EGGWAPARAGGPTPRGGGRGISVAPPPASLMNRQRRRPATPPLITPPQQMPRRLRRDHHHVHIIRRNDRFEMNAEPMREAQNLSRVQIRLHVLVVDVRLRLI